MKVKEEMLRKEIQLVIFRLQEEEFGVEINSVREILRLVEVTHIPKAPGFLEGVINLRGQIIAVVDLTRQFGLPKLAEPPKTARIVVVETDKAVIGMIVDAVPHVLGIAEEDIHETPDFIQSKVNVNYIRGIGKLADRIIVILDLSRVLSANEIKVVKEIETGEKNG